MGPEWFLMDLITVYLTLRSGESKHASMFFVFLLRRQITKVDQGANARAPYTQKAQLSCELLGYYSRLITIARQRRSQEEVLLINRGGLLIM